MSYMSGKKRARHNVGDCNNQRGCATYNYIPKPEPGVYTFSTQYMNPYSEINRNKYNEIYNLSVKNSDQQSTGSGVVSQNGVASQSESKMVNYSSASTEIRIKDMLADVKAENRPKSEFELMMSKIPIKNPTLVNENIKSITSVNGNQMQNMLQIGEAIKTEEINENIQNLLINNGDLLKATQELAQMNSIPNQSAEDIEKMKTYGNKIASTYNL